MDSFQSVKWLAREEYFREAHKNKLSTEWFNPSISVRTFHKFKNKKESLNFQKKKILFVFHLK